MSEYKGLFPDGPNGELVRVDVRRSEPASPEELQARLAEIFVDGVDPAFDGALAESVSEDDSNLYHAADVQRTGTVAGLMDLAEHGYEGVENV